MLFDEMAELCGQRNAIDGRMVEIVAEIDRDELCGMTGARSLPALVAWKTGVRRPTRTRSATVARRLEEFPRCAAGLREGRLSLDQVGVIAARAGAGSDEHYAELAAGGHGHPAAHRDQAGTAPRSRAPARTRAPRSPRPAPSSAASWRITLPHLEAAKFDAALASHRDALIAHGSAITATASGRPDQRPPFPTTVDAFMRLVEAGWDAEAARRPHGQHTTVVVHLDVDKRTAALHLGPLLCDADRRYLTCDATCEVWFERARRGHRRRADDACRSAGGCAAPWSIATARARSPAAAPPAVCMPITSSTGRTAAPPSWPTWCCYARLITGCTIAA